MPAFACLSALLLTLIPALALTGAAAAAPGGPAAAPAAEIWTPTAARPSASRSSRPRTVEPRTYRAYTLDDAALSSALAGAPLEGTAAAARGATGLVVPAPTGELIRFAVVDSPVMESGLAAAHPDIRTYAGTSVTDGYDAQIRLDVTPLGFHASVRSGHKSWYVDPAYVGATDLYLSYFGDALPAPQRSLVEPDVTGLDAHARKASAQSRLGETAGGLVVERTYRLALVTDPTYAQYVAPGATGAQSDTLVLAAKATLMNRVNQIYNADAGVRMVLVNGTDKLNFDTVAEATGANGPCGATPCYTAADLAGCGDNIDRNTLVVSALIGSGSYDIGHIGLGVNGGGVAYLGVVGGAVDPDVGDLKGGGCTGLPDPVGDFYAIDYVAHEMGHQFNGNHTFNGTQVNCSGGNRNGPTGVEPGSGSSVMAYAGICGSDDLQPHTDPYFSQRTRTEFGDLVLAPTTDLHEVQQVAFSGFDATDSFRLAYGASQTATITNASTYTAAGIKAAVEAAEPSSATATVGAVFDPNADGAPSVAGFTIRWSSTVDVVNPTVVPISGTFTALPNDLVKGGPTTNGGTTATTANRTPVVTAPPSRTIPVRTPFALTGAASDADGNPMVYLWEQNDGTTPDTAPGVGLVEQPKTAGALFRVFGSYADVSDTATLQYQSPGENLADADPTRVFPDLDQVLSGATNAATGTCPPATGTGTQPDGPVLECFSEFLPTADYAPAALHFRFTARDQVVDAGGSSSGDVTLTLDKTAGPLLATSQAAPVTYDAGSTQAVTWAVNGTDKATLAPNVRITMSTDGGQTFDRVLAASTPNDGSADVVIPDVATTTGRIRIEAVDNYFFDITDAAISVTTGTVITGPVDGTVVLAPAIAFGFSSTNPAVAYRCTLDGAPLACAGGSVRIDLRRATARTHVVTVAAVDAAGRVDPTPARRTFTVPADDKALKHRPKGVWDQRDVASAYRDTLSLADRKGATLTYSVSGATSLGIVGSTAKGAGAVKIYVGKRLVERVSLKGRKKNRQVLGLVTLPSAVTGKVRVVTTSGKPVRIDGLVVGTAT